MLDHRVYRAAFLPALVALFVVAFSLTDRAQPRTTLLAPDAFDAGRAFGNAQSPAAGSLLGLARAFPQRRGGSAADARMAGRMAQLLESTGFAERGEGSSVRRDRFSGDSSSGRADLENVIATRQGLSSRTIVVVAHRDAPAGPALADLSGSAALLELARLLADRDLRKTVVLASVSGGSGGFAGARRLAQQLPGRVEAVIVLGNLASVERRKPFVVPWANGRPPAPEALARTAQTSLRRELAGDPGEYGTAAQWLRRALPLTLGEQGPVGGEGLPAVLVSATGELRPAADAPVSRVRLEAFGRAVLRTLTAALEAGGIEVDPARRRLVEAFPSADGVTVEHRLVPQWALRALVLALLLPPLVAAFDGFFRVRRHGLRAGRWVLWTGSFAAAPLLAWAWARLLDVTGLVDALPAPSAQGVPPLGAGGIAAMVSVALVLAAAAVWVQPAVARAVRPRGDVAAGGAAAATGLALSVLIGLVWLRNPYAAGVLLPAAHVWLLASEPERKAAGRRAISLLAVLAGLLAPFAVLAYYAHAWRLGPAEGLWAAYGIVSGGALGILQGLALAGFVAALCATAVILRRGDVLAARAPRDPIVTRGPRGYAGPGSLGGTESALRR